MTSTDARDSIDVVRDFYDAFERGDYDQIMGLLHPQIELRNPDYAVETGVRHGPAQFRRALESLNQMLEFTVQLEEVRRVGDTVVVAYRAIGRGRESGAPVDQRFAHVWTFEDGKVKSLSWFATLDKALAAASR